jgi:hypothetical protein
MRRPDRGSPMCNDVKLWRMSIDAIHGNVRAGLPAIQGSGSKNRGTLWLVPKYAEK